MSEREQWTLENPGVVIGFKKETNQRIFGKIETGDEFWFIQTKAHRNRKTGNLWGYLIRNGCDLWMGVGESDTLGSTFVIDSKNYGDLGNLLWTFQIMIGVASGRETSVSLEPPELEACVAEQIPGKRVAVLKIGEVKI